MKKVLRLALCVFTLGGVLLLAGLVMARGDVSVMNIETDRVRIRVTPDEYTEPALAPEYTYPVAERLVVDANSADVTVGISSDGLIHVISDSQADVPFEPPENGTLTVTQAGSSGKLFSLDLIGAASEITVLLPAAHALDVSVSTVSGNVDLDAPSLGRVELETGSGDITAKSLMCLSFRADTISGDVDLGTLSTGDLDVSTTSGDVDLGAVTASTFGADTVSGDIGFELLSVSAGAELESTSGDVEGTLKGARAEYTVRVDTVSGWVKAQGGDGEVLVDVRTVSGDVDIGFSVR